MDEKERILKMEEYNAMCICPKCKEKVFPRCVKHFPNRYSGLLWCPACLKGEAAMFWRELTLKTEWV